RRTCMTRRSAATPAPDAATKQPPPSTRKPTCNEPPPRHADRHHRRGLPRPHRRTRDLVLRKERPATVSAHPMSYRARLARYVDTMGGRPLSAAQLRQLARMDARAGDRKAGELAWHTPPAPAPRGQWRMTAPRLNELRGSLVTHRVVIPPGDKAQHAKRLEREEPS